jgi:glutamyl-tRNA reductase
VHLLLVGASHRTASIDLRERLAFTGRGHAAALRALAARITPREAAVVSTCNRVELYVACQDVGEATTDVTAFLCDFHRLPAEQVVPHLYTRTDEDAARHLFRVASGLDSMVVGEPQILGQVKDAYGVAAAERTAGPLLNRLFHWAFAVGKRVRSETSLAEGAVSVSFAAVALAKKIFGNLTGRRVLVVGAGEMGKLTAIHLKAHGIARLVLTSRTLAHAEQLAAEVEGDVIPWDRLSQALREADIVITATGAPKPILDRARVAAALPASRTEPLFLVDIAVPRDVQPEAGDLEQVFLYNIDDLQAIVRENVERRGVESGRAEQIVDEEVAKFGAWHRSRGVIPTVVALRSQFEAIRIAELERLAPKLAHLPPEVRGRLEEVTRLIVEKLLLSPTEQLKAEGDPEVQSQYAEALSRLFALTEHETLPSPGWAEATPGGFGPSNRRSAAPKSRTAKPASTPGERDFSPAPGGVSASPHPDRPGDWDDE